MKLNVNKLKRDIEWLEEDKNNSLNDYSDVIKFLLNEVESLKQEIKDLKVQ